MKKIQLIGILISHFSVAMADPVLTSWYTEKSTVLARVIQTTSTSTGTKNTTPVTTWPSAGITNNNSNGAAQATAVYADIQRIRYDSSWVYLNCSGLASYTMGPFLTTSGGLFGFWPLSQNYTIKIPRSPGTISAIKTPHAGGPIGLMVNGVVIYDLGDAFGFVQSASPQPSPGQTRWARPTVVIRGGAMPWRWRS